MMKIRRPRRNRRDSRGSALLVSLMVIVGLSLLGLGFVAISETESAIAKNQQGALQTQAVAEAGARMAVEWFQDPTWAETYAALPVNANAPITSGAIPAAGAIKTTRVVRDAVTNVITYTGIYKPSTTQRLFDKPFRPDELNRFYGDEDHADIIINRTTAPDLVDAFNDKLLAGDAAQATGFDKLSGEVVSIRVFAPPIVGGTLINGFWSGGTRYGVATIKVTAQQFAVPPARGAAAPTTGILASHSVRLVVGEVPLPIPAGPIQGDANVSFGGNFRVHWGMETSRGDLTPSLNLSALPWANAYERPHFEHGYEQGSGIAGVTITSGGSGYASAPPVTFTCNAPCSGGSGAAATAHITSGAVDYVTMTARGSGYNMQAPPQVSFTAPPSPGTTASGAANVAAEVWPIAPGSAFDDTNYFQEVLGKDFEDPFYGARAYMDNTADGGGGSTQCTYYRNTADEQLAPGGMPPFPQPVPSYHFQYQDDNVWSIKKKVVFPTINYDYWKRITQAGRGYRGIYYFKYAGPVGGTCGGSYFQKFSQGPTQKMSFWTNATANGANLGAGVYFFDTKDGSNPQPPGADRTQLTDCEKWGASDMNGGMLMQGFVYMNASSFGTTGVPATTTVQANFPGEVFRDVGYPKWSLALNDWDKSCGETSPGANDGQICRGGNSGGIGNGSFDCQDLTTGNPHTDGKCRIVVMPAPTWKSYDPGAITHTAPFTMPACGTSSTCTQRQAWVVKTWKSRDQAIADYGQPCSIPGNIFDGSIDGSGGNTACSEPHEPYLNLIFPTLGADNNGAPYKVVVGWEPPDTQTFRPKQIDNQGVMVPCPGATPHDTTRCTSNAYDVDGAVVPLDVLLQGILYQEGQWGSEGNGWYFGSILVQDVINLSSGTADVWFDEKLLKGTWAPPGMPRVIVFSEQTDEQTQ